MSTKTSSQPLVTVQRKEQQAGSIMRLHCLISASTIAAFRPKALASLNQEMALPGFRKGKIPEAVLVSKVGEMTITQEAVDIILQQEYANIITGEKIDALGTPRINLTKVIPGQDVECTIETAFMPPITIGDYKAVGKEYHISKSTTEPVTDTDVDTYIENLRTRLGQEKAHEVIFGNHSEHDHGHRDLTPEEISAHTPALDDAFAKSLGTQDLADLKNKLRERMQSDRLEKAHSKRRAEMLEKIASITTIDLPEVIIESESKREEATMREDLQRANIPFETYIQHIKKTVEELRKEWRAVGIKRATTQLALNEIAKKENLEPDETRVAKEVLALAQHYKDAPEERLRTYIVSTLRNEMVIHFLENQGEKTTKK
jgi:trigger factor